MISYDYRLSCTYCDAIVKIGLGKYDYVCPYCGVADEVYVCDGCVLWCCSKCRGAWRGPCADCTEED